MTRASQAGTRPRHLLLVAMFFPPSRASGVYRGLAIANHFARRGWQVTVVTVTPAFFDDVTGSRDDSLLARIDPRVTVERVPMPAQHLVTDVRRMSFLRAHLPRLFRIRAHVLQRRSFPDRYVTWVGPVVRRAVAVHRRSPIGLTIATGNPWSAFRAAWGVRRRLGVPYVMDYRDSWTLDQFTEREAYAPDSPQGQWERRMVADAARVTFVNEPMREWHAERFPEHAAKMLVVQNGYDPEDVVEPVFDPPPTDRPLRFGYVGTVTAQLPHEETWAGWRIARRAPELAGATVHLHGHVGFFPRDRDAVLARVPGPDEGVHVAGAVPKAEVGATYAGLDVILMMVPSSRYVTAGKSYESMATGRPVVAIHTPETAASIPLRGYPLWFPVERLDAESVAEAIVAAARAARAVTRDDFEACLAHASRHRRDVALAPLESAAEEVSRGG